MATRIDRREWLARGLGAAGLVLGGGLSGLRASDEKGPAPPGPDRSQKAPASPVAITRCGSYEPKVLRRKLDETLNLIGGIQKLVEGKTVTVKLNLTGGPKAGPLGGLAIREALHPFNPKRLKLGKPLAWQRWNHCRLAAAPAVSVNGISSIRT